jgi:hypothetical protein
MTAGPFSRRHAPLAALLTLVAATALAQAVAPAAGSRTRAHIDFLASDSLEGRFTGTPGEDAAARYLVAELERLGAKPLPGRPDFRIPFEFTADVIDEGTSVEIRRGADVLGRWTGRDRVLALSFSDAAAVSGPAVFAGYGLRVPGEQGLRYDSYAGLDVKDKVVVVLRYFPEDASREERQALARYAGLRYKAMAARQLGARGLLVVTGPRSPRAGELVPLSLDTAAAGSGIAAATVSGELADRLFAGAARSLTDAQQALDSGNPHVAGFALDGVEVSLTTRLTRRTRTAHNIVGVLRSTGDGAGPKPWVMLGAHYDHLGRGGQGSSLASEQERNAVHAGADDNASGVAAVLAAAAALSREPRPRHVALAFWSGEEIGLVGSTAFTTHPPFPLDQLAAYVNFDMVGRLRDNRLTVQAVGSSGSWPRLVERANGAARFTLSLQNDPHLPTDSSAFNQAGVPTLSFFTGSHEDYHRPTDIAGKIDVAGLDRIAAFAVAIVGELAAETAPPAFVRVAPTNQGRGGRDGIRLFTGTIPDYATQVEGLLLGGVVAGGPAETAGLRKGDVIVELAGQKIANIYDYTYALDVMKPDVAVPVVYLRGGERLQSTLTPRVRK